MALANSAEESRRVGMLQSYLLAGRLSMDSSGQVELFCLPKGIPSALLSQRGDRRVEQLLHYRATDLLQDLAFVFVQVRELAEGLFELLKPNAFGLVLEHPLLGALPPVSATTWRNAGLPPR